MEIAYAYDNANQLTSITYSKGGTTIGDLVYTYDAAGRRTKVSGSLAKVDLPAAVSSGVYNAGNRLTSWAGSTFSYDLNGNLTGDGTNTYSWDARNQLSSISGGVSASFGYDATGRRRTKTIGSSQTGFVYDGLNFVQELTGSTANANLLTGGIDEVFQRKEATATRYPITDALGSVIALTDGTGALATEYSFEPYGKATRSGSADNNSQSFTAREDDGTGLFYYRARYYMPGCGRFITEDPIGILGGPNSYLYVGSAPTVGRDTLGLRPTAPADLDPPYRWQPSPLDKYPCEGARPNPGDVLGQSMAGGAGTGAFAGLVTGIALTGREVRHMAGTGALGVAGALALAGKTTIAGIVIVGTAGTVVGLGLMTAIVAEEQICRGQ